MIGKPLTKNTVNVKPLTKNNIFNKLTYTTRTNKVRLANSTINKNKQKIQIILIKLSKRI